VSNGSVLRHHNASPAAPVRTVILGSGGFIGGAIVRKIGALASAVAGLGRNELDLIADGAAERLAERSCGPMTRWLWSRRGRRARRRP
jgi:hypothetical protein